MNQNHTSYLATDSKSHSSNGSGTYCVCRVPQQLLSVVPFSRFDKTGAVLFTIQPKAKLSFQSCLALSTDVTTATELCYETCI